MEGHGVPNATTHIYGQLLIPQQTGRPGTKNSTLYKFGRFINFQQKMKNKFISFVRVNAIYSSSIISINNCMWDNSNFLNVKNE